MEHDKNWNTFWGVVKRKPHDTVPGPELYASAVGLSRVGNQRDQDYFYIY